MAKKLILLCAVAIGGPVFDKAGRQTGTAEKLVLPGPEPVEVDDATAERLIALGAAREPVAELVAQPQQRERPPQRGEQPPGEQPQQPGEQAHIQV